MMKAVSGVTRPPGAPRGVLVSSQTESAPSMVRADPHPYGGGMDPGRSRGTSVRRWAMGFRQLIGSWPVLRQLQGDPFGLGASAQSPRSATLVPRTATADRVVRS